MVKKLNIFMICIMACLCIGCSKGESEESKETTTKAYTFSVDTGDSVKISLNTTDGYDLTSELPFTVLKEGETLSQGTFIAGETYGQYVSVVNEDPAAVILDSGEKDGNEYLFWSYNDSEFNYAILIDGSSTGVLLGNPVSEECAKECFERLTMSLK